MPVAAREVERARVGSRAFSMSLRVLASINVALLFALLILGKHAVMVESAGWSGGWLLDRVTPFWIAPTTMLLVVGALVRAMFFRRRSAGFLVGDFAFVAADVVFLGILGVSWAGM